MCSAPDRKITIECAGDASGTWDGHRVAQAVSNLLGNAVHHSPAGTHVHVHVRGERDQVVIDVHNEGAIPDDRMTTLFEAFASSTQRAGRHEGLGLGLFIARAISPARTTGTSRSTRPLTAARRFAWRYHETEGPPSHRRTPRSVKRGQC